MQRHHETRTRGRRAWLGLLLACALLIPASGTAEESRPPADDDKPPGVVLVLSGGGARGAAHIGVLEVMEELRVPVDMIIGTSMGAIVGGMYASGLSPQDMREELAKVDWDDAFNDEPPRRDISFRRKEDDARPLFKLEMGFGPNGFSSPSGLVSGQKLNFILRTMLLHTVNVETFDDLAIPYRAMAVDLDTGEAVVLDSGSLAMAIRASMAFPVMFTPVEIDGHSYVDGGVLRNLPINIALELGAQRVIAVDVSSPLKEMKEGSSAFAVLKRTSGVMSQKRREEQVTLLRDQDLLMIPDLAGLSFGDFDKMPEAIQRGREIALQNEEQLRAFSVPQGEFDAYLARHRHEVTGGDKILDEVIIAEVEVTGVRRVSPKLVAKRVHTQPGEPLDLDVLQEDLERVYQIGEFEQVDFRLEPQGDQYRLVIDAREKSWGPWYVRFGAALEATFDGTGNFTGIAMLRRPQINRLGAEWKSWFTLGQLMLVDTEFYQPIEYTGTFFVAPRLALLHNDVEFILDEQGLPVPIEVDRTAGMFDFGVQFRNYAELRLGVSTGWLKARPSKGSSYEPEDIDLGGARARLVVDRLDNADFPGRGGYLRTNLFLSSEALGADEEYERFVVEGSYVAPMGKFRLAGTARIGTGFGDDLPFYDDFELGGFFNLSGSERREYIGDQLGFARLVLYRKTGEMPGMLGGDFYLGGSLEAGAVWQYDESASFDDLQPAGSLFAGVDTILGPFYAGVGVTEGGRTSFYIFLGRLFGAGSDRLSLR